MESSGRFPHLKLPDPNSSRFTSVNQAGSERRIPFRDRYSHGIKLKQQLDAIWNSVPELDPEVDIGRDGIYVDFIGEPGFELATKSLESVRSGIRLCCIKTADSSSDSPNATKATIFIPFSKRHYFANKINDYLSKETAKGKPKNAPLINSIANIQDAILSSFWQDDIALLPSDDVPKWVEIWLIDSGSRGDNDLYAVAEHLGIKVEENQINFPERIVKMAQTTKRHLEALISSCSNIAEFRLAKETADFLANETPANQTAWSADLLRRLNVDPNSKTSICILDTGINRGHPLLAPAISVGDCLAYDSTWSTSDHQGHGTLMAGIATYGDLNEFLISRSPISINHKIESVKILPSNGSNKPELWGDITSQCVSIAEINQPTYNRCFCMAIASRDTRDRGKPSSWSSCVDKISFGDDDFTQRLMILCAGNIFDQNEAGNYPDYQLTESIHDPAQSWNAITVGAYTELDAVTDVRFANYDSIANRGQLSPFTTTSVMWEKKWPNKPDVVFEGGNLAINRRNNEILKCESLSLLTTYHKFLERHFHTIDETSAATSMAAHFASQIMIKYPQYWPETIRALIVHSAQWTPGLLEQFAPNRNKTSLSYLMRICGYGVPNLSRALECASNSLTLIAQKEIKPFIKEDSRIKTNEMHLYNIPWPREALEELGGSTVKMRVTLSYFIEPAPGEVGYSDRYRYPSHGLRFSLNSPTESKDEFMSRINAAARDDDADSSSRQSESSHWTIGKARDKGSIHSDIWIGSAVELISTSYLAIFPTTGWWKERQHLNKYDENARYSLVVSIHTQESTIDIYSPVAIMLEAMQNVAIEI